jgi:putative acetyltransferase
MIIREESPNDVATIHRINASSFDTEVEANLVDALRTQGAVIISLLAEEEGQPVGHILFSPVTVLPPSELKLAALAPMAVLPKYQGSGIGTALVRAGIEVCREQGCDGIVVLGHAHYYPRFGFKPASSFGLRSEYDVPMRCLWRWN